MILEISKKQLLDLERMYRVHVLTGVNICGHGILVTVSRTVIFDQLPSAGRIMVSVSWQHWDAGLLVCLIDDNNRPAADHVLAEDFPLGKLPEMARAEYAAEQEAKAS